MIQIDMEMPKRCLDCQLMGREKMYCQLRPRKDLNVIRVVNEKPDWCPLKEVPTGKWICESKGRNYADYHCSVCGQKLSLCGQDIHERMTEGYSLYCDRCGAKMVEKQQGENT